MKAILAILIAFTITAQAQVFLPHRKGVGTLQSTLSPPCQSSLIVWLDASQTFDGKVADGTVISNWFDISGNNNNFTNSVSTNRPTYYTNQINGKSALRFFCTNQTFLSSADTSVPGWWNAYGSYHIFYVLKADVACGATGSQIDQGNGLDTLTYVDATFGTADETLWPDFSERIVSRFFSTAKRSALPWTNIHEWAVMDTASSNNAFRVSLNGATNLWDSTNTVGNPLNGGYVSIGKSYFHTSLPLTSQAFMNGWIAEVLIYNTSLSDACRNDALTYLSSKYSIPTYSHAPVNTNGIVAMWHLDETSGTRVDSFGANNLTANNTPGNTTGIFTNASTFVSSSSQSCSINDNAALSMGANVEYSISMWVRMQSTNNAYQTFLTKGSGGAVATLEYTIFYDKANQRFYFNSSNGAAGQSVGTPVKVEKDTWYLIVGVKSNAGLYIYLNDMSPNTGGTTASTQDSTGVFAIGGDKQGNSTYADAYIDDVIIWKNRKLSYAEVVTIYNAGVGRTYPAFTQ